VRHPAKALTLSICICAAMLGSCRHVFAGNIFFPLSGSNSASASSWLGGAQLGHNWQRNAFVYGLETDISAMHLKSEMNTVLRRPGEVLTADTNSSVDWYGTFRGRIGWATGPILLYGTGGFAYGNVKLNSNVDLDIIRFNSYSLSSLTSTLRTGWVAGGGIEYLWYPNVILNLGYQYVDLGTINLNSSMATPNLSQSAGVHAQFSVVSVGLSWLFAPTDTVSQAPWAGTYVGGHVGGAWGNSTNASYSFRPNFVP
jgi:outer membrane immunogenic protein